MTEWDDRANVDLVEIAGYHTSFDLEGAEALIVKIIEEIETIADNPLLKRRISGLPARYQRWSVVNKQYVVYYTRLRKVNIKVLRIRSSRQKPLSNKEII